VAVQNKGTICSSLHSIIIELNVLRTSYYRNLGWDALLQQKNDFKVTIFYRVKCAYKHSVHLNFTMIFGKIFILFLRIISQELIIASLFIIKAMLNPFSATFHV